MSEFEKLAPLIASALRDASLDTNAIVEEARVEFERLSPAWAFAATSPNPMDRRLSTAGVFLALVKVLERRGEPFEKIRAICLDAARAMVMPKGAAHAAAKRAIGYLGTTRVGNLLFERVLANAPTDPRGFRLRVLNAREQGFDLGFDILECGITRLYREAGAEKYAPLLCEVDLITSQLAGLELHREGTIANGAPVCDFRFRRKA